MGELKMKIWVYQTRGIVGCLLLFHTLKKPTTAHNSSIRSDQVLRLKTSGFKSFTMVIRPWSIRLIKPSFLVSTALWLMYSRRIPWEWLRIRDTQRIISVKYLFGCKVAENFPKFSPRERTRCLELRVKKNVALEFSYFRCSRKIYPKLFVN